MKDIEHMNSSVISLDFLMLTFCFHLHIICKMIGPAYICGIHPCKTVKNTGVFNGLLLSNMRQLKS